MSDAISDGNQGAVVPTFMTKREIAVRYGVTVSQILKGSKKGLLPGDFL